MQLKKSRRSTFSLGRKERWGNLGERIEGVKVQTSHGISFFSTVFSAAKPETMAKPAQVRSFSPFCSTSPGPGLFLESLGLQYRRLVPSVLKELKRVSGFVCSYYKSQLIGCK